MKNFSKYLLFITVLGVFTGCLKKKNPGPKDGREGFYIVGEWKLTKIDGTIDSIININNKDYKTTFKTTYDSVSTQMKQTINGNLFIQYPYAFTLNFGADASIILSETMTRFNSMGVPTPYDFNYYSTWNYTNSSREADGLVIRSFDNTHVLGLGSINPAQGTTSNIGTLLNKPMYTSYDVQNGHLLLYVHTTYSGTPDTPDGNGGFYNPRVVITANYELMFSRK